MEELFERGLMGWTVRAVRKLTMRQCSRHRVSVVSGASGEQLLVPVRHVLCAGFAIVTLVAVVSGISAAPSSAAINRHMLFFGEMSLVEGGEGFVEGAFEANSTGTDPKILQETPEPEALSPNGREIAFVSHGAIELRDIGGGPVTTVYAPTCNGSCRYHDAYMPQFSPDGAKLIFVNVEWYEGFKGGIEWLLRRSAIDTVSVNGSELTTIVPEGAGHSADPEYSPDGTKIVYAAYAEPESSSSEVIVVANADGSSPTTLTEPSTLELADEPRFSPDGEKIAFDGTTRTTDWQIFTINTDGSDLTQLTKENHPYEEFAQRPQWSPEGSKVIYEWGTEYGTSKYELYTVNSNGSGGEEPFVPASARVATSWNPIVSPAGSTAAVSNDEYLGLNFEPLLRFNSTEKWRPLNVASFMREEDPANPGHSYNKLCTEAGCEDIPTEWQSALTASVGVAGKPYIKMGKQSGETYPGSPLEECHSGELVDCNSGSRAAIYYHVVPSATAGLKTEAGYNYIDYWIFYRYNQDQNDPLSLDDHQGDWEGITVAPSLTNPSAFDFAIFAQHADFSVYAPENLDCDESGEEGSCGKEGEPDGHRPWDYVAVGTHASYPGPDEGGLTGICMQALEELPEGCHDGKAPWGADYEAADDLAFPPAGEGNWVDWPGRWGADTGSEVPNTGKSPESPGNQGRFICPWRSVASKDPTACPSRSLAGNLARAREAMASACSNWFGGMVALTACSPAELSSAVHYARMGRRGSVRIAVNKHKDHAASLPGVVQVVGRPLSVGEHITLTGHMPGDAQVFVRAQAGNLVTEAVFDRLGLGHGGRGTLRVLAGTHGPRMVWIRPDGREVGPVAVRAERLRRTHSVSGRPPARSTARIASGTHRGMAAIRRHTHECRRLSSAYIRSLVRTERLRKSLPLSPGSTIRARNPRCR